MELSHQAISEFQQIWKEEFGGEIDDKKANESGIKLLQLVKLLIENKNGEETKIQN